jgi:hypothetical protein
MSQFFTWIEKSNPREAGFPHKPKKAKGDLRLICELEGFQNPVKKEISKKLLIYI